MSAWKWQMVAVVICALAVGLIYREVAAKNDLVVRVVEAANETVTGRERAVSTSADVKLDTYWQDAIRPGESSATYRSILEDLINGNQGSGLTVRWKGDGVWETFVYWSHTDKSQALVAATGLEDDDLRLTALNACATILWSEQEFYEVAARSLDGAMLRKFRYKYLHQLSILDPQQAKRVLAGIEDREERDDAFADYAGRLASNGSSDDYWDLVGSATTPREMRALSSALMHADIQVDSLRMDWAVKEELPDGFVEELALRYFRSGNVKERLQKMAEHKEWLGVGVGPIRDIVHDDPSGFMDAMKDQGSPDDLFTGRQLETIASSLVARGHGYATRFYDMIPEGEAKGRCAEIMCTLMLEENIDVAGKWVLSLREGRERDAAIKPILEYLGNHDEEEACEQWEEMLSKRAQER